jgi:hypothetical protein
MAKKKKQSTQRRLKMSTAAPRGGGSTVNASPVVATDATQCVGLINPFSSSAEGMKIPDDDSTPSFTAQVRTIHTLTTDANGNAAMFARARPLDYPGIGLTLDAARVVTVRTNIPNPDSVAYLTHAEKYRVVSWGIRVYSVESVFAAKGTVRVTTMTDEVVVGNDTSSLLFEDIYFSALSQSDIYWTSKPTGNTWKEYVSPTVEAPWTQVMVSVEAGNASTDVLLVDFIYNLEVVPKFGSITASLASPAADHNPRVITAAANANNKKRHTHEKRETMFASLANLARNALVEVAGSVIPYVGRSITNAILPRPSSYPLIVD